VNTCFYSHVPDSNAFETSCSPPPCANSTFCVTEYVTAHTRVRHVTFTHTKQPSALRELHFLCTHMNEMGIHVRYDFIHMYAMTSSICIHPARTPFSVYTYRTSHGTHLNESCHTHTYSTAPSPIMWVAQRELNFVYICMESRPTDAEHRLFDRALLQKRPIIWSAAAYWRMWHDMYSWSHVTHRNTSRHAQEKDMSRSHIRCSPLPCPNLPFCVYTCMESWRIASLL